MGNYNVRKISDLDEAVGTPWTDDLFYVSRQDAGEGQYSSKKIKFQTIADSIVVDSVESARLEFGIISGTSVQDDVVAKLDALSCGQFAISSAEFVETPTIRNQPDLPALSGNMVVTRDTVVKLVDADKSYISLSSSIDCMPDNFGGYTKGSDGLLKWHFNPGGRDSSEWAPQRGTESAGYVRMPSTGQLVVYGWLADNGGLNPEECWVAVFGKIKCLDQAGGEYVEKPVALAVQPWIVGAHSQVAQYVGFQLPVKEGMEIKIMTGFNVNGSNSGFGNAHSLMLSEEGVQPNTFVGYVIK